MTLIVIIRFHKVLGERMNTHTYIRKQNNTLKMSEHITPFVMDPRVPVKIDLEMTTGE